MLVLFDSFIEGNHDRNELLKSLGIKLVYVRKDDTANLYSIITQNYSFMETNLIRVFEESVDIFFQHETQNILSNVAERNLCGRLSIYITKKLDEYGIDGYYADTEYNRKQDGRVKTILDDEEHIITIQCDLIVHSRGKVVMNDNLIAIEMKKSNRPEAEKIADRKRLRTMTKDSYDGVWSWEAGGHPEHVCGYILGVYMIMDKSKRRCLLEYYSHGKIVSKKVLYF